MDWFLKGIIYITVRKNKKGHNDKKGYMQAKPWAKKIVRMNRKMIKTHTMDNS